VSVANDDTYHLVNIYFAYVERKTNLVFIRGSVATELLTN